MISSLNSLSFLYNNKLKLFSSSITSNFKALSRTLSTNEESNFFTNVNKFNTLNIKSEPHTSLPSFSSSSSVSTISLSSLKVNKTTNQLEESLKTIPIISVSISPKKAKKSKKAENKEKLTNNKNEIVSQEPKQDSKGSNNKNEKNEMKEKSTQENQEIKSVKNENNNEKKVMKEVKRIEMKEEINTENKASNNKIIKEVEKKQNKDKKVEISKKKLDKESEKKNANQEKPVIKTESGNSKEKTENKVNKPANQENLKNKNEKLNEIKEIDSNSHPNIEGNTKNNSQKSFKKKSQEHKMIPSTTQLPSVSSLPSFSSSLSPSLTSSSTIPSYTKPNKTKILPLSSSNKESPSGLSNVNISNSFSNINGLNLNNRKSEKERKKILSDESPCLETELHALFSSITSTLPSSPIPPVNTTLPTIKSSTKTVPILPNLPSTSFFSTASTITSSSTSPSTIIPPPSTLSSSIPTSPSVSNTSKSSTVSIDFKREEIMEPLVAPNLLQSIYDDESFNCLNKLQNQFNIKNLFDYNEITSSKNLSKESKLYLNNFQNSLNTTNFETILDFYRFFLSSFNNFYIKKEDKFSSNKEMIEYYIKFFLNLPQIDDLKVYHQCKLNESEKNILKNYLKYKILIQNNANDDKENNFLLNKDIKLNLLSKILLKNYANKKIQTFYNENYLKVLKEIDRKQLFQQEFDYNDYIGEIIFKDTKNENIDEIDESVSKSQITPILSLEDQILLQKEFSFQSSIPKNEFFEFYPTKFSYLNLFQDGTIYLSDFFTLYNYYFNSLEYNQNLNEGNFFNFFTSENNYVVKRSCDIDYNKKYTVFIINYPLNIQDNEENNIKKNKKNSKNEESEEDFEEDCESEIHYDINLNQDTDEKTRKSIKNFINEKENFAVNTIKMIANPHALIFYDKKYIKNDTKLLKKFFLNPKNILKFSSFYLFTLESMQEYLELVNK